MQLGTKHKVRAIVLTILVFTLIVAILLWVKFRTPIPPYPEGGGGPGMGLEVNLGSDIENPSLGKTEENIKMPDFKPASQPEQEEEKIATQDIENEEVIAPPVNKVKTKIEPKKINSPEVKPVTQPQPIVNQKALFKSSKNTVSNDGQAGEKGSPNGTPGSSTYIGDGTGSGNGQGGGKGNGVGPGIGDGVSFSLDGRIPSYLDVPKENFTEQGKVVVEITVDREGKVISATPGVKGSTTLDDYLLQVAKKAALQSKFNRKPNATIQKGTITYRFVLQ
jgi:TonB family protein